MKRLFSLDSWFWRRMSDLSDWLLLSIMWIACCLPMVTIGPATKALYYVMLKRTHDEGDEGIWRLFWRAFRDNWKVSTIMGVLIEALGVLLYLALCLYLPEQDEIPSVLGILIVAICTVYLLALPYLMGLLAWFNNTVRKHLLNSLYLMLSHLFRTLAMLFITALTVIGVYFFTPLLILAPSFMAWGHAVFLTKIFDQHTSQKNE